MRASTLTTGRLALAMCAALLAWAPRAHAQQELGHKTLGTLGLKAGSQQEAGLYVADRVLLYDADELFDRNGTRVPIGFHTSAVANGIGIAVAYQLPRLHTYVNAAFGAPLAHVNVRVDRPDGVIDRFGLGDLYVQPLKLGWRLPRVDLVTGYAFYVPTGRFEPGSRGGVSRAQWSHELSLGGTISFDHDETWQLSVLASYELPERKLGIDLTRGDTVQLQGGLGKTLAKVFDVGLVGYALWQVRDDRGSALPAVLRGARDRAYGLGAELGVTFPKARTRVTVRYAHDLAVTARPLGELLLFGLTSSVWRPAARASPRDSAVRNP